MEAQSPRHPPGHDSQTIASVLSDDRKQACWHRVFRENEHLYAEIAAKSEDAFKARAESREILLLDALSQLSQERVGLMIAGDEAGQTTPLP